MSLITNCPVGTEIRDITSVSCPQEIGQITKIILQRYYSTGTTRNEFTISSANPNVLASWSALLSAEDGTKVQATPLIGNPTGPTGEQRTAGGGNQTPFGIEKNKGRTHATFSCELQNADQRIAEDLKYYEIEDAQVYFVNESGFIIGEVDSIASPTKFRGFRMSNFYIGDLQFGGYDGLDMNPINLKLYPNWSDKLYVVKPTDFNPNTNSLSGS